MKRILQALLCALTLATIAPTSSAKEPAGKVKNVLLIMSDDLKASDVNQLTDVKGLENLTQLK